MQVEELLRAVRELEKERNLPREVLVDIIRQAIIRAYHKHCGEEKNLCVDIDFASARVKIYAHKIVVEKVKDPSLEISLTEARKVKPNARLGEVIEIEVTPKEFGRIAAQTAKNVLLQRIREVENRLVREECSRYLGKVTTGIVLRKDGKVVYMKVGRAEAILPPAEQVPREHYHPNDRFKVYVLKVEETPRVPRLIVSRSHPNLVKGLFEIEVPEITSGIVEIKGIAREPGSRTKLAIYSHNPRVDPLGTCVGPRGARVQSVVNELRGEKIDLVRWSPDMREYIANALSPAKVKEVYLYEEEKRALVIVPEEQLSLAIGKEGQNVRLAVKLIGWHIDIRSEEREEKEKLEIQSSEVGENGTD
ncbi:MAG: transcription termination factor NusA [bacterium]